MRLIGCSKIRMEPCLTKIRSTFDNIVQLDALYLNKY